MITQFKDLVSHPITLYAKTYEMLLGFAKSVTGSEVGGRYLIAALASKVITIFFRFFFKFAYM